MECKEVIADYPDGNDHVLIETLWNVKLYTGFAMTGVPIRINRNIVECKEHNNQTGKLFLHVLIETLWNVK